MNKLTPFLLLVLLSGCAANPASIAPDNVSSEMYAEYSCETLRELRSDKTKELEELSKSQKTKRIVDGFSNVLILPGLASVIPDSSSALGRSKGEMNALIREYDRRCIRRDGLAVVKEKEPQEPADWAQKEADRLNGVSSFED